jgi:hypothetical protein
MREVRCNRSPVGNWLTAEQVQATAGGADRNSLPGTRNDAIFATLIGFGHWPGCCGTKNSMKLSAADFVRMLDAQPRAEMEAGVHNTKFPRLKQALREGQALLAEASSMC